MISVFLGYGGTIILSWLSHKAATDLYLPQLLTFSYQLLTDSNLCHFIHLARGVNLKIKMIGIEPFFQEQQVKFVIISERV